jgi:signal transduction histidine kinase
MYSGNQAIRDRVERERAFSALEDMHRQLADAHYQLELSAERDAELAIVSERNRLAREMHDTIGQALVLIVVKLEAAQRLRAVQPERADYELELIKEMVRTTMRDLRDSLADLRLPIVSQHSIGEILARRTRESSERAGFLVTYQLQPDLDHLSVAIREALYRITIEALTNIEKHAHAHAITLSISSCDSVIALQLTDDGVGLPVEVNAGGRPAWPAKPYSPPGHYGITGMRERAEALGGHLIVDSRPGQGTTIKASIPLSLDSDCSSAASRKAPQA